MQQKKLATLTGAGSYKNKRVLVRLALNVPFEAGVVKDDYRIQKVLPTLRFLKKAGAKSIVISHFGSDGTKSLGPVAEYLGTQIAGVSFCASIDRKKVVAAIDEMKNGDILVLENIRRFPEEEDNKYTFARDLALLAERFVNEDFPAAHRAHASVVGVPKFLPSVAGPQFTQEVRELSRVFEPKHPFIVVLGGAKFSTKVPLVRKFLKTADWIFISGALANTFFKAQGFETGKSLIDTDPINLTPFLKSKKVILPIDVVVKGPSGMSVKEPSAVMPDEIILDVGQRSIESMYEKLIGAKMILWNGPLGKYEDGFTQATERLATIIAQVGKKNRAETIVGGGDTVAAIEKLNLFKKFTFVSTGGGAMLDYLAKGTLPGIEAILKSKKK